MSNEGASRPHIDDRPGRTARKSVLPLLACGLATPLNPDEGQ